MHRFILSDIATVFAVIIMRLIGYGVFRFIIVSNRLTVYISARGARCRFGAGILTAAVFSSSTLNVTTVAHLPVICTIIQICAPRMSQ